LRKFLTFAKNENIMTTMQLQTQIQQGLDILNTDEGLMQRLAKYVQRLVAIKERQEAEFIRKDEILEGIDAGLREVKHSMETHSERKTARDFLNEL